MAPFPYPSTLLSSPGLRFTPNRCTAATNYSLPFLPPPPGTPLPQLPHNHWCSRQMSGSPYSLAPTALFSGIPFPMLPNSPFPSQQVPLPSWISSPRHALLPVLPMACAPSMGRAPVRLVSLVLHVNRARRVSSVLDANPVHPTVASVTRESQAPVSALPP